MGGLSFSLLRLRCKKHLFSLPLSAEGRPGRQLISAFYYFRFPLETARWRACLADFRW
jgi:hypothetical protein